MRSPLMFPNYILKEISSRKNSPYLIMIKILYQTKIDRDMDMPRKFKMAIKNPKWLPIHNFILNYLSLSFKFIHGEKDWLCTTNNNNASATQGSRKLKSSKYPNLGLSTSCLDLPIPCWYTLCEYTRHTIRS